MKNTLRKSLLILMVLLYSFSTLAIAQNSRPSDILPKLERAYNNQDIYAIIDCFDPSIAEATFGLMDLFGLDSSAFEQIMPLFSEMLGASGLLDSGQWGTVKLSEVSTNINGSSATLVYQVNLSFSDGTTQSFQDTIQTELIDGIWYISAIQTPGLMFNSSNTSDSGFVNEYEDDDYDNEDYDDYTYDEEKIEVTVFKNSILDDVLITLSGNRKVRFSTTYDESKELFPDKYQGSYDSGFSSCYDDNTELQFYTSGERFDYLYSKEIGANFFGGLFIGESSSSDVVSVYGENYIEYDYDDGGYIFTYWIRIDNVYFTVDLSFTNDGVLDSVFVCKAIYDDGYVYMVVYDED